MGFAATPAACHLFNTPSVHSAPTPPAAYPNTSLNTKLFLACLCWALIYILRAHCAVAYHTPAPHRYAHALPACLLFLYLYGPAVPAVGLPFLLPLASATGEGADIYCLVPPGITFLRISMTYSDIAGKPAGWHTHTLAALHHMTCSAMPLFSCALRCARVINIAFNTTLPYAASPAPASGVRR